MYVVSGTALVLSMMMMFDPISFKFPDRQFSVEESETIIKKVNSFGVFLFSISILVVVNLRHGILTIKAKKDHQLLRSPSHLALNSLLVCAGLYLASIASSTDGEMILFYVFSGICIITAVGNLRYSLKKKVDAMEWLIAHLGSMLGAGIALHTAFFVFGGSRFIAELLTGQWMLVPWVGPGVIGTLAIIWQSRKYRNKYRHLRNRNKKSKLLTG